MDRTQKIYEKNGIICLIMFTPRVRVIKSQKWHIFVFSAEYSKKSVQVWAKYLSASERSYLAFLENTLLDYWLLS